MKGKTIGAFSTAGSLSDEDVDSLYLGLLSCHRFDWNFCRTGPLLLRSRGVLLSMVALLFGSVSAATCPRGYLEYVSQSTSQAVADIKWRSHRDYIAGWMPHAFRVKPSIFIKVEGRKKNNSVTPTLILSCFSVKSLDRSTGNAGYVRVLHHTVAHRCTISELGLHVRWDV